MRQLLAVVAFVLAQAHKVSITRHDGTTHSKFDCSGSDGLDVHAHFPHHVNDELPVTDIRPALEALGVHNHSLFDLGHDGVAVGHSHRLALSRSELEGEGWAHRPLLARIVRRGLDVLRERHQPERCQDIRPSLGDAYGSIYSNTLYMKQNKLVVKEPKGPPWPAATSWRVSDVKTSCEECGGTGWHRDGGSESRLVLWIPVFDQPLQQWPLVFLNTTTLMGQASHAPCVKLQEPSEKVQLLFWSDMQLGDYIVFDGMRLFHASGILDEGRADVARSAVSISYDCIAKSENSEL